MKWLATSRKSDRTRLFSICGRNALQVVDKPDEFGQVLSVHRYLSLRCPVPASHLWRADFFLKLHEYGHLIYFQKITRIYLITFDTLPMSAIIRM